MKTRILALLALILIISSCNGEKREIKQTAYRYLDAMGNYRLDDAVPYASEKTNEVTIRFYKSLLPTIDTNNIKKNTPAKITINEVVMQSDTTAYAVFHKTTPITQQDDTLRMIKENGKWLAHVVIAIPSYMMPDSTMHFRHFTREEMKQMSQHIISHDSSNHKAPHRN